MNNYTSFLKKYTGQKNKSEIVIFGAGTIGRLTFGALKSKNINPSYFCDSDIRKQKSKIEGIEVISPETLYNFDKANTDIFISANYFKSILPSVKKQGFENIYVATELLEVSDIHNLYKKMDRKFFVGELFPLKLERTVAFYNEMGRKEDYINSGKLNIKTIDVQITEKCSLKCKDCSNLMQYYAKPIDEDYNELIVSIDKFLNSVKFIREIRLIGGEPLIYKKIDLVIKKLLSYSNFETIHVYTNGTIVLKDEKMKCFQNEKILFKISDYGKISRNVSKLEDKLNDLNVKFITEKIRTWQDCAKIEKFNRTDNLNKHIFGNCCENQGLTLLHGTLYLCPFNAHAENLNAIPKFQNDKVILKNLSNPEITESLRKLYFKTDFLSACDFCNGRDHNVSKVEAAVQTKEPLEYAKINQPT